MPESKNLEEVEDDHGASPTITCINIINNILGGALLVMPTAFYRASLIPGLFVLTLLGLMSSFSMYILILSSTKSGQYAYKGLLAVAYSERVAKLFEIVLFLYPFGILIAYSRVIGDATIPVAQWAGASHGVATERWFWLIIAGIVFWGLSSLKTLTHLKFTSFLGTVAVCYVGVMVFGIFLGGTYKEGHIETFGTNASNMYNVTVFDGLVATDVDYWHWTADFFQAIPVTSTAFSCHYNIPPFYHEMSNRSPARFIIAAGIALFVCYVCYLCSGIGGLLMMGNERISHAKGDILNVFRHTDVVANIGRLGMVIAFLCSFPAVAIAARRSLNQLCFGNPVQKVWIYVVEAGALVLCSAVLAYFVPGVDVVLELFGAAFGVAIVVIVPCLIYIRIFSKGWQPHEEVEGAVTSPLGTQQKFNSEFSMPKVSEDTEKETASLIQPKIPIQPTTEEEVRNQSMAMTATEIPQLYDPAPTAVRPVEDILSEGGLHDAEINGDGDVIVHAPRDDHRDSNVRRTGSHRRSRASTGARRSQATRRSLYEATAIVEHKIHRNKFVMTIAYFNVGLGIVGAICALTITIIRVAQGQH